MSSLTTSQSDPSKKVIADALNEYGKRVVATLVGEFEGQDGEAFKEKVRRALETALPASLTIAFTDAKRFYRDLFEEITLFQVLEAPGEDYARAASDLQRNKIWKLATMHLLNTVYISKFFDPLFISVCQNEAACRLTVNMILLSAVRLAQKAWHPLRKLDDWILLQGDNPIATDRTVLQIDSHADPPAHRITRARAKEACLLLGPKRDHPPWSEPHVYVSDPGDAEGRERRGHVTPDVPVSPRCSSRRTGPESARHVYLADPGNVEAVIESLLVV
ncbi:hypothetical protein B0H17DRAFT_1336700 [Mycena rosella]|uniref:Uncharacterized protein n=1 Tax=Mycena rosella TaxID=1033263 RepID=A0AAD7CYJ5_MYCRO|nr:hypothetical protein B0H17DRAFT_1336700 [Mycena rosella]